MSRTPRLNFLFVVANILLGAAASLLPRLEEVDAQFPRERNSGEIRSITPWAGGVVR